MSVVQNKDNFITNEVGSYLYDDLSDKIRERSPAIKNTVNNTYSCVDALSPVELTYIYSETAFGNARYANGLNYMPVVSYDNIDNDIEISVVDRTIIIDGGTPSASGSMYAIDNDLPVQIPAGNYKVYFEVDSGSSTINYAQNITIRAYYADSTQADLLVQAVGAQNVTASVTVAKPINKLRFTVNYTWKNTYDNHRIWVGLYSADTTFTDLGDPVVQGETTEATVNTYNTPSVVDTVQHKCNCTYVVDTKQYVDNHTQSTDFIFYRPEDYGAKGDGVTDDYAALQACINDAQSVADSKAHAIRGYGTYRIGTGLVFDAHSLDVYLNKILYTGGGVAITMSAQTSNFVFETITSQGSNTASGIRCYQSTTSTFAHNRVQCAYILALGNTVEFMCDNEVAVHSMMYNTFYFQHQSSLYGNIVYVDAESTAENSFYGKHVSAQNGYLVYYTDNALYGKILMHNYCLESALANGTNKATLQYHNCRFDEMLGLRTTSEESKGYVYKYYHCFPYGITNNTNTAVNLTSVSVADAYSWADGLALVAQNIANGLSTSESWGILPGARQEPYAKIERCYIVANGNMTTGGGARKIQSGTMYVYCNNIAYKPDYDVYKKVTNDMTIQLSSETDWYYETPTTFYIMQDNVTIKLDASYCCIAINEFTVIQPEGKTAIIKDKFGNTIFDGANYGPGTYKFKCRFVPYEYGDLYVTVNSTTYNCPGWLLPNIYSGYNESWEITKIPVMGTTSDAQAIIDAYWEGG